MNISKTGLFSLLVGMGLIFSSCTVSKDELYQNLTKVDAHVHIRTTNQAVLDFARKEGFKLLTINTRSESQEYIDEQMAYAKKMKDHFPQYISYITTFSMENFEDPGWADQVIQGLKNDFEQGAIGVKVWKDIGMTFRDSLGNFVFLDDPLFEPILEFISNSNKPMITHIGEPKNCWLPVDSMTVNSDKSYFTRNPQYHMYLHPDYPSYERLIASRDNVLARYPDLRMIGAHLGSLEYDVDQLAERLDRYPNFSVDLAARVCHLQVQDRDKVREFLFKYQDRILYATDIGVSDDNSEQGIKSLGNQWKQDWDFFATADSMTSRKVDGKFRGLDLEAEVLRKIFSANALHWYPGV